MASVFYLSYRFLQFKPECFIVLTFIAFDFIVFYSLVFYLIVVN